MIINKNDNVLAIAQGSKNITYKDLHKIIKEYASYLKREGTSPVVIYRKSNCNFLIAMLSVLESKRTYIPVGICTPINRLKEIVKMTKASLVITDEDIILDSVRVMNLFDLKKFKKNKINIIKNDIVYIIFTSGSTGISKGVPISKDNLSNFIKWISNIEPLRGYKKINVLNTASFSFDLSVASVYYSLCNGQSLILMENDISDYKEWFDEFKNKKINLIVATPTFIKMLLLNKDFNGINYNSLKCIYFCGEILEVSVVKKLFDRFEDIKIINAYGPTEATSAVSSIVITKQMLEYSSLPIGEISSSCVKIEIKNDEIVLKGKSVFNGYIGKKSKDVYIENNINCYKTGDIGYINGNILYIKDRKDRQIKYKGYRIELLDIEKNICKIDGVVDCATIAIKSNKIVKRIKAFTIVNNKKYNEEYITNELKKKLPEYMIPIIVIVDSFPVNKNGKIDRRKLEEYDRY